MHSLKSVVVLCLAALPVAAQPLTISGGVYLDPPALADRSGFTPAPNATISVYRDGGDRVPSADDARVATTATSASGVYTISLPSPGDYWVAVDSHSLGANGTWPEQTFGPAGSLCAQPDGAARSNYFEGPCFGGRTSQTDNATSIATAEHVALVHDSATRVDFAFSFNAVTSLADASQGSLRQFVVNANAIGGPNAMRFVPLARAAEQRDTSFGVPPRWWKIALATPLPELRDSDTVLDGTAYNFLSPASAQNIHPGAIGEPPTIKPNERTIPRLEKPELELQLTGAEGIVCAARCGIRAIALHGAAATIVARADARIEHVLVGAAPDGLAIDTPGETGVQIESGTTVARFLLATMQTRAGIIVGHDARLDGERLDVSRCGDPRGGAGVVLLSDGSAIRASTIAANNGAGIIIGSLDGSVTSNGNTIDGSTISSNQGGVILGPGSSRNVIARNDIMWNRLGGVTIAPFTSAPPRDNRVSANRFDENGLRPIILNLGVDDPNQLWRGAATCTRNNAVANNGITPPQVTSVRLTRDNVSARVTIRGRACAGDIVELYQSFVTSGVREDQPEVPKIRSEKTEKRETLTAQERESALPSIGEFNYLGSASTAVDGTFEATFPLPIVREVDIDSRTDEENHVWASQVLRSADPDERAFSAIAIDSTGNTSEMSVRRRVD
ncbi:MAG TPA: right-handed parallel beta-helix repeat-containing protein [Thermoanaerobaculia bacterium]|nr:right-handed parallel beta-helix repeat-containing protein [Thermoanaerobaculia bacterium]